MGKRPVEYQRRERERFQIQAEQTVKNILAAQGYEVTRYINLGKRYRADLVISRTELGRERRIAVDVKAVSSPRSIYDLTYQAKYLLDDPRANIDEFWIVVTAPIVSIRQPEEGLDRRIRIMSIDDLKKLFPSKRTPKPKEGPRTRIGRAALSSEKEIQLAVAGLILQIDAKLETLRDFLPNDPDSQAKRDAELSELEQMKAQLERIREMVAGFKKKQVPEKEVVKSVETFGDSVKGMWNKHRDSILATTGKTALFVSAVGVLSLFGGNSAAAVAVAGAIIEPNILGGLKKITKKLPGS